MEEVHELKQHQHHSKIALFAIVGFLAVITLVVIVISKSLQSERAYKTSSYAEETSRSGDNSVEINLPESIDGPIEPAPGSSNSKCSGKLDPVDSEADGRLISVCCVTKPGQTCSGSSCFYKWWVSCSDGRKAPLNFGGCYTKGDWQDKLATDYCCNKPRCDAREETEITLESCETQCVLARQHGRYCETKHFTDPTTGKKMISCCPGEKPAPPTPGAEPTTKPAYSCSEYCNTVPGGAGDHACQSGLVCVRIDIGNTRPGWGQCFNPLCIPRPSEPPGSPRFKCQCEQAGGGTQQSSIKFSDQSTGVSTSGNGAQ